VFGREFAPDDGQFLKLTAEACIACDATSVAELALLLGLEFPGSNPGETRVFDCNKPDPHGNTALLLACKAGSLELATMLKDAGADINEANEQDDTALLLACKAGSLELATMLKDAGADVSVANNQGETPLLAALAAGNLELATVLLSWGADVKAERRDGAGLIALAIHSKRPDSISFTYDMIAVCT
jgi:ankyrin repeat protein